MNIQIQPDARLVDIRILEVPFEWKGITPDGEIGSAANSRLIKLVHEPTGIQYSTEVEGRPGSHDEIAVARAESKLKFIHELHGQAWLND